MTRPEYNRGWPALRLTILERDNWQCQIRGPHCKGKATEVDHIIPISEGGSWRDPSGLRAVCRVCHNGRKARTLVIVDRTQSTPSRDW